MDWVPSGSRTSFPYVQGEFTSVGEGSGLGSGSAQASPVGEVGPAQPAEVRKTTRVSFHIPSSPSPADPDEEEEEDEDRDSLDFSSPG